MNKKQSELLEHLNNLLHLTDEYLVTEDINNALKVIHQAISVIKQIENEESKK